MESSSFSICLRLCYRVTINTQPYVLVTFKSGFPGVRYTIVYTGQVTFCMLPEQHGHVYLVRLFNDYYNSAGFYFFRRNNGHFKVPCSYMHLLQKFSFIKSGTLDSSIFLNYILHTKNKFCFVDFLCFFLATL